MPALSPDEEQRLRELAKERGDDPDEVVAEVVAALDNDEEKPSPGKTDAAAPDAASSGAESGAKAHGGRGYFAYEYPFLRVNEVRASLFLDPVPDGDLYTTEWLSKHGGSASATPPVEP